MLFARVIEFAALRDVAGARQGREDVTSAIHRIAAAMVPVQMRVDDDVDRVRIEAVAGKNFVRRGGSGSRMRSRARSSCRTPPPVSIRIRWASVSTTKQLKPASIRFNSSLGSCFDQRVFGTTPNIAPPSHQ